MAILRTSLRAIAALAPLATSQFVAAPTDLKTTKGYLDLPVRYKEVPEGICELTPGVKSYSGYVDIAEHQHIFWWFFEARNEDPTTAPLSVWINGGPGSSSMIGLFQELGPCGVNSSGDVYYNPYAYNNVSNMLFIDHPAQVGFSYSIPIPAYAGLGQGDIVELPDNTCPDWASDCGTRSYPSVEDTVNTTISAAPSMWKTLQGFMGAFPQYARHGFHFTTESYGGHYGPVFNEYIETQNALIASGKLHGAHKISLESVMIGNGWYDPLIQYAAYYNFTVSPGNTYDVTVNSSAADQMYNSMYGPGNCYDMTVQCYETGRDDVCSASDAWCANEVEDVYDTYLGRDEYDVRELASDPFPYNFYVDYLNTEKVQRAIGAFVNYSDYSSTVGTEAFGNTGDDDRTEGSVAACRALINQGVYLVQYNGDADYNCNWLGNQAVIAEIAPPGLTSAGFENLSTPDAIVHGQIKQSANFAFARVYESGHEVPFYQPVAALTLFNRTIHGVDLVTGLEKVEKGCGYKTVGPSESTYREGNATVVYKNLPETATYNTTTNRPNPPSSKGSRARMRRGVPLGERRTFKRLPSA